MDTKQLLDELLMEEIRDEILTCVIIRNHEPFRPDCMPCTFYFICKRLREMEEEELKLEKEL